MTRVLSLLLIGCTAAPVVACATFPVAQRTVLDEKVGIAVTLAYTTASRLGNRLARAGLVDQGRFKALDDKGYAAVLAVRKAYDAGNATDYAAAVADVTAAVEGMKAL